MGTIAENIKTLRKNAGMTQKQLAKKSGLSIAAIQGYEQGKYEPKIETVDRIALALGVRIIDILEHFTLDQYKNTIEYQKTKKAVRAEEGIIALLEDIYGKVEDKEILGKYSSGHYLLIGEGKNQFVLYDGDIDALYDFAKAGFPALIDRMKDNRPEDEIIKDYLEELNTPIPGVDL